MIQRPPDSHRTYTPFPYPTLFRSFARQVRRLGQPEDRLPAARGDQPDRRRRRHRRDRPRRHAAARGAPRSLGEQRGGQELMISFSQIEFWNWWVIAVFLLGIEVFAPGAVFLWMGIAAGVVVFVLLALPPTPWQIQILVFAGTIGRAHGRRCGGTDGKK